MVSLVLATTSAGPSAASVAGEVVSLAVLAYILYSQRKVRPLRTKLTLPVVLAVVGLSSVLSDAKTHPLSSSQIAVLVGLFVGDAIGLGVLRAFTVRLWREGQQVFRQGSWLTIALWLVGVAVHESALAAAHINSSSLLLYVGLTLASQRLVLDARVRRLGHVADRARGEHGPEEKCPSGGEHAGAQPGEERGSGGDEGAEQGDADDTADLAGGVDGGRCKPGPVGWGVRQECRGCRIAEVT